MEAGRHFVCVTRHTLIVAATVQQERSPQGPPLFEESVRRSNRRWDRRDGSLPA